MLPGWPSGFHEVCREGPTGVTGDGCGPLPPEMTTPVEVDPQERTSSGTGGWLAGGGLAGEGLELPELAEHVPSPVARRNLSIIVPGTQEVLHEKYCLS